jgi:hypothetical protein
MGTGQAFVGRMDESTRFTNEVFNRLPVNRAYHRASAQSCLPARDDDPLIFHLEQSKFQRASVCLAIDKLRVAVAHARDEAQRGAREVDPSAAPHRVRHELPIRDVDLGRCGGLPMRKVLLHDGKEPAGNHHAIRRLERRLSGRASG